MLDATLTIEEARRHLHEIIRRDAPFDERARETLELATRCLGVDNGHLTRIDEETDHWEAVITTDTADGQTPPDLELDLGETYCRKTIEDDTPLPLHDAASQGWHDDPALETRQLHTYLGIPLIIDDAAYGTVCFVAEDPQSDPFDDAEIRFAEHLSRLLERELEREHVEAELTNQTNFSSVLNRVLRHNLRNDISVVRGYAELISDQLEDDTAVSKVLNYLDDIIKLSDKARELEEIITTSTERQHIEIGAFIEGIVEQIEHHHPDASISVEYDDEIHVDVLQNFDRAIEELVENAVTHGGENPTVTVAVDEAPNAVEIRLSDDGPGLPESEAKVLEAGAETPLTHGSGLGLWMAHWIVTSHDGSLDPVATEDGTTLEITLPRRHAVGIQQQLTELERSRDKYKATFEEATDAIAIVNDDGRIIEANPATGSVFGVDSPEVIGRSLTEFLPAEFEFDSDRQHFQQVGTERDTLTIIRADGAERVLEYSAIADITPGQHLFISRDVTDRKEREAALQETKQRLDLALDGTDTGVWEWDIQTDEVVWSESMERLFGLDPGTFEGTYAAFKQRVHPDDREKLEDTIGACLENGEPFQLEYRIHRTDGTERWVQGRGEIHEVDGTGQMVGVLTDITERKERERKIEQEQARFKAVFDDAFDPMVIADDDGRYIEVNESATELFGIPEEELLGETVAAFAPDDFDFEAAWRDFQSSEADRGTFPLVRADGSERIVEYAASRDIVPGEHLSVLRDITERTERERELELAETVFQNTQDALVLVDVVDEQEYRLDRVNDAFLEVTPYDHANIIGMTPRDMLGDEVGGEIQSQFQACVTSQESVEFEQVVPADGGSRIWQVRLTPLIQDGEVTQLVVAMRNITDRIERDRRYNAIFNQTYQFTGLLDTDGTVLEANETVLEFGGFDREDVVGKPLWEIEWWGGDDTRQEVREAIDRAARGEFVRSEIPIRGDDDTAIIDFSIRPITDEQDNVTLLIPEGRDITERIEREQQLELAETVFENTQDALFVIDVTEDQEFYIERVNAVYEELTGLSNEEIQGKTPREVVDDDIGSEIEAQYRECVERRETIQYPEEIPVDGELRHWHTKLTPVVKDGRVVTLVGAMRDVTAQKI